MIALNLALALAPAVALFAWAYRRDRDRKQTVRPLAIAFLRGLLGIVPSLVAGLVLSPFSRLLNGVPRALFQSFVIAALVEESVKFGLLDTFLHRRDDVGGRADGVVYGMTASLGFAFLENAFYLGAPPAVLLVRGVTAVPLHAGCGAIVGYSVAHARSRPGASAAGGVVLAIAVHGLYNLLILLPGPLSFLGLVVIGGLVVTVPLLLRRSARLDPVRNWSPGAPGG